MVEKKSELRRRRSRGKKLAKAKTGGDKDTLLKKIHRISPWWKEAVAAK